MLKKFPLKKEYLLILAIMIMVIVSYQLAFKKTIEAWRINKQLKTQLTQSSDLSVQPAYLERKNLNLDKILKQYRSDTVIFRSNTLGQISSLAEKENVKLSEVPLQDPLFHTEKFTIQRLALQGNFFSLLKVLSQLKKIEGIGTIRSAELKMPRIAGQQSLSNYLILEIYLEAVI